MNFEKLYNILFYNFRLLDYQFRKFLIVYINPFCWISNFSKLKIGLKFFISNLDNNFPIFLILYRQERISKYYFFGFISLTIYGVINVLLSVFQCIIQFRINNLIIISIISSLIAFLLNRLFLFKNDKFYEYHKEFIYSKKYRYPIMFLIGFIVIYLFSIFSFLI
jgi:hypothetical protein